MKFITNNLSRARSILLTLVVSPLVLVAQDVPTEKPKQLPAAILRKYDADKDGILNEEEKSAWKADVQRGRQEAQARRLERYDSNRDGKLDKSEKAAASTDTNSKRGAASKKRTDSEADQVLGADASRLPEGKRGIESK
ncbi:MAG TPA: hypothetical protein PLV87_00640 [Opitutaceae bacterium]|nr:hypothetical protein [Opitutaceae bacterium]